MVLKFKHAIRNQIEMYECYDIAVVNDVHYYTTEEGLVFAVNHHFGSVFDTSDNHVGSLLKSV